MLSRSSRSAAALVARRALSTRAAAALPRAAPAGAKREFAQRIATVSAVRSFHASPLALDEIVKVPSMAESLTEGTLKQWLKQPGDFVEADEEVATIETDKIDIAVNAPKAGTIKEHLASEEDTVTVGQDLFKLEPGSAPEGGAKKSDTPKEDQPEPKEEKKAEPKKDEPKKEAPKKEQTQVEQKSATEKATQGPKSSSKPEPAAGQAIKQTSGSRNETRVKMSRMRQRISERLKESQNAAASLTTFNEIDMSSLMSMRAAYKDKILKEKGVKLGFMSAFAKASTIALKEIPAANASIEGDQIVYRDYVDLSVAVATPKGLVTPVLRNAEGMSFLDIEQGIVDLGKKARDNKLTLEDMAGGSFTISNGGVFGSLYGTPIINTPQAAVLGMHAIKDKAVVVDGKIVIRPIMVVALTYDHRLLDGREAVTFLVRIKELIEDPRLFNLA